MRRFIFVLALGLASVLFCAAVGADTLVQIGSATGGLMIHYNNIDNASAGGIGVTDGVVSGFDENPANIAYIDSQFSATNTNGGAFSFVQTPALPLQSLFGQISPTQFGLDLNYKSPTYNSAGGVTVPSLNFKDNVNGNAASATTTAGGTTAFAIDDYLGTGGPGSMSALNDNSLLRGTALTFNVDSLTLAGNIYTLKISGTLVTDGLVHWYTPSTPDTPLSAFNVGNTLVYNGTFQYDKTGDTGATQTDFYTGGVTVFAQAVPLPPVAWVGLALMGGLAATRWFRAVHA